MLIPAQKYPSFYFFCNTNANVVDVINDISNISKSYEILDPLPGIPGYPDPRLVLNNLCNNTVCLEFHSQYLLFQKSTFQNIGFF